MTPYKTLIITKIPFPGFYESDYSAEVDQAQENDAEHHAGEDEENFPPELRLSAAEYAEAFYWSSDYSAAYQAIARNYVSAFDRLISEEIGAKLNLSFESMTSPREYNFETDRVFAFMSQRTLARLFIISRRDNHETLAAVIKERFTGRSGFIPFYKNTLDSWLSKELWTWDHNEVETLLIAVIRLKTGDEDSDSIRWQLFERLQEGVFYAWSNCVDWEKFRKRVDDLRADKEAEARKDDPDYIPPAVRCPFTLDLFQGS